ncbi:MAG: aspartate/tyrosine/aromatic aminotransferase [Xanthomonadales bacterium]|nr:aspartate/tyrosine/aromatic aminotransferase [Xanthomonadales bacterium]
MFETLQTAPDDPILGLMARFRADSRAERIDLGVGVFRDADGHTPILDCVRAAEQMRLAEETTKTYQGMAGDAEFNAAVASLALGDHAALRDHRVFTAQTPGGTAALRVAADLLKRSRPDATLWLPDSTWANHGAVFRAAGLAMREFPYYDAANQTLRGDAMLAALAEVPANDVVVLHACCHNPSGVDVPAELWPAIADLAQKRGFLPFIDMAYQGFGEGLDADAQGPRLLAAQLPELLLATSCSKNFGLYRERTGAISLVAANPTQAAAAGSVLLTGVRNIYSMPPAHGAAIVARILTRPALRTQWLQELTAMRERIAAMRSGAVAALAAAGAERDFGFIARQHGMFSFLGLTPAQITRLRDEFAVYMLDSSRINIAGLAPRNLDHFAHAVASVLRG